MVEPCRTIGKSIEPGHIVERLTRRKLMRLLVGDHLQPVFDPAKSVVAFPERTGIVGSDPSRGGQCIERGARSLVPQRGIAPAMNQLVRLREEFDLANPPAAQLHIVAGRRFAWTGLLVADAVG